MPSNKSVKTLRAASKSQSNYKKTVAENKQEFYQDLIDETFENATDYMEIKEETFVGSNKYQTVGVRVTHAINSSSSNLIAKEFKKIIFKNYDHEQYLGKKYKIKGKTWLTTDMNEITNLSSNSLVRLCNNTLKWYNPNNKEELFSEPCVFTDRFVSTSFDEGSKNVMQVSGDFQILVQLNEKTKTIAYNQRFVLNGLGFQVEQYNNHRSNTLLFLKIKQIDVQANDNVVDNIANDNKVARFENADIRISPQNIKILEGESQEFSVYKYIDGEESLDEFTFRGEQAPTTNYRLETISGNKFKITNIAKCPVPLIVRCVAKNGGETSMNIVLGGIY